MEPEVAMQEDQNEWKKREEMRQKRIDKLKAKLPGNQVVKEISGGKAQEEKRESGKWELVDSVLWAGREAYFEEGLSLEQTVNQMKEALDAVVEICKNDKDYNDESEEYKRMKEIARS